MNIARKKYLLENTYYKILNVQILTIKYLTASCLNGCARVNAMHTPTIWATNQFDSASFVVVNVLAHDI